MRAVNSLARTEALFNLDAIEFHSCSLLSRV